MPAVDPNAPSPISGETRSGKTVITICLGSSCFPRGNGDTLPLLQERLAARGLQDRVVIQGSRCEGQCLHGPNIRVGEHMVHGVRAADLDELLERFL